MKLLEVLIERNISKLQLALNAKIAPNHLYSALNGKGYMFPKYRKAIAEYLEMDEQELFPESEGKNE